MKDEITEIKFIEYNGIEGYIELMKHDVEPLNNSECKNIELYYNGKDIKAVLDYITNLQKENEILKKDVESLKNYYNDLVKMYENRLDIYLDLKTRNEKAIKLLKYDMENFDLGDGYSTCEKALNLLQEENIPQENLYKYTSEKGFRLVGDDND